MYLKTLRWNTAKLAVNTNQSINIYPKSHNILEAEILLKLALNTNQSINQSIFILKATIHLYTGSWNTVKVGIKHHSINQYLS